MPDNDHNGNGRDQPPAALQPQMVGVILAVPQADGQVGYQLQWAEAVTNPLDFCLLVSQVAIQTAMVLRQQAKTQGIQVPKIQFPPGFNPKGLH